MDASILAAGAVSGLTIAAAWLDLRKRTNGSGPIAAEIKELRADISEVKAEVRDVKADVRDLRRDSDADRVVGTARNLRREAAEDRAASA